MTILLITPLAAVISHNLGFAIGQKYFGPTPK
jgi:hypothetical protein